MPRKKIEMEPWNPRWDLETVPPEHLVSKWQRRRTMCRIRPLKNVPLWRRMQLDAVRERMDTLRAKQREQEKQKRVRAELKAFNELKALGITPNVNPDDDNQPE